MNVAYFWANSWSKRFSPSLVLGMSGKCKKFSADIRGKGLFWGVEFVVDKITKEPFAADQPIADLITAESIKRGAVVYPGMKGTADGVLGDHVMLCPPFIISEDEIRLLVDILVASIKAVV
jgi:adenosylmethionine-8-amino-7-oxononanoate aminotransferase